MKLQLRTALTGLLLFVFSVCTAIAQQTELGVYAGVALNDHIAAFRKLGTFPSCCPSFDGGSGSGISAGLFGTLRFTPSLRLMGRISYSAESGDLYDTETSFVADPRDGLTVVPAIFEHKVAASLSSIGIEPLVALRLFWFDYMFGVRIAAVTTHSFRQTETLIAPQEFGEYLGEGRVWVDNSGEIPDATSLRTTAIMGLRMMMPLNKDTSLFLAPEVFYHYPLSNVSKTAAWQVAQVRFGLALGFGLQNNPEPPQPPPVQDIPVVPVAPPPPVVFKPLPPSIRLEVKSVDSSGRVLPILAMQIQEIQIMDLHPLLGHVYFNKSSATIPERYATGADAAIKDTTRLTPFEATHGLLGIVALRLKANPTATLKITGNTSDETTDKGLGLAKARAEAVRTKLIELGIDPKRLVVDQKGYPVVPTKVGDAMLMEKAHEENRRVELSSSNPAILAPFVMKSVQRVLVPPTVQFEAQVTSAAGVQQSKLEVIQGKKKLYSFEQTSEKSFKRRWTATDEQSMPLGNDPVVATATVTDSLGQTNTVSDTIPVEKVLTKSVEHRGEKTIERYSLILFGFNDERVLGDNAALLKYIAQRIGPNTSVKISGMTDVLGSDEYNRELSRRRAAEVGRILGIPGTQIEALGEEGERFTNSLPEGRAYNRTVVIELVTIQP